MAQGLLPGRSTNVSSQSELPTKHTNWRDGQKGVELTARDRAMLRRAAFGPSQRGQRQMRGKAKSLPILQNISNWYRDAVINFETLPIGPVVLGSIADATQASN